MMKRAIATLESISNYSQSRYYSEEQVPKNSHELFGEYEKRTWRNRMHVTEDGFVFVPPMAWKNCLSDIAKYRSEKIPGKGNATYTKRFQSGILCMDRLVLPDRADEVPGEWLFVPPDGVPGSGRRVEKCFPLIARWQGAVTFYILDGAITEDVFHSHLSDAGSFIGIGRFRPAKNGYYGRFVVKNLEWQDFEGAAVSH
jgi:hypothetical protein